MNKILAHWLRLYQELDNLKASELDARLSCIKGVFEHRGLLVPEGTVNLMDAGYEFKAVFRQNYKVIDEARLIKFLSTLPEWQRPRLVKWTPELRLGEYRKLEPRVQGRLDKILEVKAGTPGLSAAPK